MSLVDSLLSALVRADGDALVLHTGECPYVVSPTGQTELASRVLTTETMTNLVAELLPPDARRALDTVGAVQHDLRPSGTSADGRFAVVAARGGDDIWVEIRRHRKSGGATPRIQAPTAQPEGLDRLLRIAAERGATTMYLTSQGRPCIRVEGEIRAIEEEGILPEAQVQALLRGRAGPEWVADIGGVGRVRCVTFTDHRGAGAIFRMVPERAISAEQLALSDEVRNLCAEAEGLICVAGPKASGKSTLLSAFVDIINRTRSEHVITLERRIDFVHVNRGSLVSQREARDDEAGRVAQIRAALQEEPDVLVIEDVASADVAMLAVEAAQSRRLVIGALNARSATDAVDRLIEKLPRDRREHVQAGLAGALRGIVAQVLVRRKRGGWVAAREVLFNNAAVAGLISSGTTLQLPQAIEDGRPHGMMGLNDALAGLVRTGVIDAREGHRGAFDKPGFLALLARSGSDSA